MAITKVSSGVISANAVTATIVAENVITSSEIATDGVGTLQIADDAVTSAKLDTNIDIAGTLDVTGVLTADSNVVIAGNLTVNGSTVTNSSTNTTIEDALIELGTGTTGTPANDAGIIIERGDSNNAFIGFDESADKFIVATTTATGSSTGDLTLTAAPLVTGALTASGLAYPTSDGSANQVIKTDGSGNLSFVTAITDGAVVHNYTATGDGSTATFDTGINPQDEVNTWVHIDGVYQNKSEYSYNGTSITFTSAPDSGAAIDIITGNQNGFSTADSVLGIYSATTTDTATYDTGLSASTENNVNIFIEGVYQPKSTYTWSGSTITFDANTPTGLALEVIASKTLTSGAVVTASITDSAVTTAKIADNAITSAKIVNNSITGADISATTNIVASTFTGALTGNVTGNVTGNLTGTIQTAAQGNITSLGTLTALTGGTGDLNWDSGTLFVDSSANNVGIGETNPDASLHITSNTPIISFDESDAGQEYRIGSFGGSFALYDSTDSAYRLVVDGSGAVGIGVTSILQGYKLEVAGHIVIPSGNFLANRSAGGSNWGLIRGNDSGTTILGDSQSLQITAAGHVGIGMTPAPVGSDTVLSIYNSATPRIKLHNSTTGTSSSDGGEINMSSSDLIIENREAGNQRFFTNGAERMRITSDGEVRVNAVARQTMAEFNNRQNGAVIEFGHENNGGQYYGTLGVFGTNGHPYIGFSTDCESSADTFTTRGVAGNIITGDIGNGSLKFMQVTSSSATGQTPVERMRIKSDGQITTQGDIVPGADVIMANGRGISFAATANSSGSMSNELLDDYEEGTFTMQFHNNGTNPTVASVENTTAYYTKIGNTVRFFFYSGAINISNIGTGSARLTGLPFNSVGGSYSYSPVTFAHTTAFDSGPTGYTVTGSNYIQCTDELPATAGCQYVTGTRFIMVSGVYQTS